MSWKGLITLLVFVIFGAALVAVRPALSPWYFADFRLDRSADDTVEAAYAAAPANRTTTRAPAQDVETTGFATNEPGKRWLRGLPLGKAKRPYSSGTTG